MLLHTSLDLVECPKGFLGFKSAKRIPTAAFPHVSATGYQNNDALHPPKLCLGIDQILHPSQGSCCCILDILFPDVD